ncbi:hypothetical protein ACER0C_003475 [Sarotherodon galilaeus]
MFSNAASRKRANAQPVDDMTRGLLPPKKTWRTATLGRPDWDTGNAFTITYDVIQGLPCVTFVSTHPTVNSGHKVLLAVDSAGEQLFADKVVIPLRVFLDLLHMHLTHNEDKYLYLYTDAFPSTEDPDVVVEDMPASCADVGCYHMVAIHDPTEDEDDDKEEDPNGNIAERTRIPQDGEGNDNNWPKIPEVSKEHLIYTGIPGVCCSIVRQPRGPLFLTTCHWHIRNEDGEKTTMMATDCEETEYVFPLCHTEQLPGLVAVIHQWLKGDYQKLGLLITCNVPSNMTLIPKPIEALGYKYTLAVIDQHWPLLSKPRDLWHTSYEGTALSVEPEYGICRTAMIKCPHSKRHCPI